MTQYTHSFDWLPIQIVNSQSAEIIAGSSRSTNVFSITTTYPEPKTHNKIRVSPRKKLEICNLDNGRKVHQQKKDKRKTRQRRAYICRFCECGCVGVRKLITSNAEILLFGCICHDGDLPFE